MTAHGSCLCGAVSFDVEGPLRPVIACHCGRCRKMSGHHVAATAAPKIAITIKGADEIQWFAASEHARRGFCRTCGPHLFWEPQTSDKISIFAGSLDRETGLAIERHIYCAGKGDYYQLTEDAPKFSGAGGGAPYP